MASSSNRAAVITNTHKVLKKHYSPVAPPERTLLEHLLYACCLENAPYDTADDVFARLQQLYFDWNEVRVTTVTELTETMGALPDPVVAASNLKRALQTVFETHYSFDIESLKKQNLGKAIAQIESYGKVSPFALAYVTQIGLGGHAIPLDAATLEVFHVLGVISDAEKQKRQVPGLERAISKSKGIEYASLLHQLAADFRDNPHGTNVRAVLVEIEPDCKERLPKRSTRKTATSSGRSAAPKKKASRGAPSKKATGRKKSGAAASGESTSRKKKKSATRKKAAAKTGGSKRLSKRKPR